MHFSSAFNSKSAQILLLYPQEQYTYYIKIAEYMCMMCICMYRYWLFTYKAYDIQLYFTSTQHAGNIHVHVYTCAYMYGTHTTAFSCFLALNPWK